jgi:hypothetical protein
VPRRIRILALATVTACGPSLLVDGEGSGSAGSDGSDDANDTADGDDSGGSPSPSAPDEGPAVQYDVGAPTDDGGTPDDTGTSDEVCTEAACFAPALAIDDTPAYAIAIADLDADGLDEIIAGGDDGLRVFELAGGRPSEVSTIATTGRVIAIAAGQLDDDAAEDIVALTDAQRVVVVEGGSTGTVTQLIVSDGQRDVALSPLVAATPTFATVSREGLVTLWRRSEGGWSSSFFEVDGAPTTIAVGASQGSSTLVVTVGDPTSGRLEVLALDGDQLLARAGYHPAGGDPVQLDADAIAPQGALPELVVLSEDSSTLQMHGFTQGVDSLFGRGAVPLSGSPHAFAIGGPRSAGRDIALVDDEAGTLEICTLGREYSPSCTGAVLHVGEHPSAVAVGMLGGTAPEDIAIASSTAGVAVVLSSPR